MKRWLIVIFLLFTSFSSFAQVNKPLKFNRKGEFKIVQFTDVHYILDEPKAEIALERINDVLKHEKPDLVVFTGDIIFGRPAEESMKKVLEQVSKREIPFVVTFGNHDREFGKTNTELYDLIRTIPYNLHPERQDSCLDFELEIFKHNGGVSTILYFLDSHTYNRAKKQYDWILPEQIERYKKISASYTEKNGGVPYPSVASFHIPLPEVGKAAENQWAELYGTRMEKCSSPVYNSGMYKAMVGSGDVMGVFFGHDHNNDYLVRLDNIIFGYGRYTGGNTVYNSLSNGGRVIVLKEGKREFETWLTLKNGERINFYYYK